MKTTSMAGLRSSFFFFELLFPRGCSLRLLRRPGRPGETDYFRPATEKVLPTLQHSRARNLHPHPLRPQGLGFRLEGFRGVKDSMGSKRPGLGSTESGLRELEEH